MCLTGALQAQDHAQTQEYKFTVDNTNNGIVSLEGFSGDLTIEGYSGNEIIFITKKDNYQVPERAKGLKPIYPGGVDNTGIGLSVEKIDNQIQVTCLIPFTRSVDYTIKVPENLNIKVNSGCQYTSDIKISKMKNEVEVKTCHNINLSEVSGPLVLNSISGDITITFGTINTTKPFSISSVSGDIDITLPSTIGADIEMQSVSGTMYSDFDFSDEKAMKKIGGNHLSYKLNGGGTKFKIVSVSSNIYLRKGK